MTYIRRRNSRNVDVEKFQCWTEDLGAQTELKQIRMYRRQL